MNHLSVPVVEARHPTLIVREIKRIRLLFCGATTFKAGSGRLLRIICGSETASSATQHPRRDFVIKCNLIRCSLAVLVVRCHFLLWITENVDCTKSVKLRRTENGLARIDLIEYLNSSDQL